MKKAIYIIVLGLWLLLPAHSYAQGVAAGESIPHDLKALDQNKQEQSFETLTGENGMVLVFVRSADWCPFCQKQLLDLAANGKSIEELGYSVVTLSYDSPQTLSNFAQQHEFPYTMLSDPESKIIKAFGILNEDMQPGSKYYGVPHPVVYVIGADKTIQARIAKDGYKNRPEIAEITDAINTLNSKRDSGEICELCGK